MVYIENHWHLLREVRKVLKNQGFLIISDSNVESIRSILSFIFRGYHICCPPNYPGHISYFTSTELNRIVNSKSEYELIKTIYIKDGMIPGTALLWSAIIPGLKGRRYSDSFTALYQLK